MNLTPLEFPDLLGGVPVSFPDQTGGKRIKADSDGMLPRAGKNPKPALQLLFGGKAAGTVKRFARGFRASDPRQGKCPDLSPLGVMRQQIPSVVDVREMVGVDMTCLMGGGSKRLIGKRDFLALNDGSGQQAKNFQVGRRGTGDAEGIIGSPFPEVEADGFLKGPG